MGMKLWHCKKCGTFIGHYGYDELCPTCRRKETYFTKEEVVTMLEEIKDETKKLRIQKARENVFGREFKIEDYDDVIQSKIDKLKGK